MTPEELFYNETDGSMFLLVDGGQRNWWYEDCLPFHMPVSWKWFCVLAALVAVRLSPKIRDMI